MHYFPSWYFSPFISCLLLPTILPDAGPRWDLVKLFFPELPNIFFFLFLIFVFLSGIFHYFTFCWFLVAVVCETPLHVSMFTGSLMHIPAQRFGFSAVQILNVRSVWRFSWILRFNGNFIAMKSRFWWQNEGVFLSVLMSEVFVVLLTTRVSDKPVWTSPK